VSVGNVSRPAQPFQCALEIPGTKAIESCTADGLNTLGLDSAALPPFTSPHVLLPCGNSVLIAVCTLTHN